ncbi:uncharacterized protein LOC119671699 [Teleopsis dalmanni]|uniref:uncharacterized protein LOC119671699 n=1 Tax=Teleopsis dalmanni TaxID=139649 RepID=UPI0018CEF27B|nr:uncharacterized protein LOC119671699 [Teleopsis dalmanni]
MAPVNSVCNNFVPPSRSAPGIGRINYNARPSVHLNGADLPQDVATLRYFFNLGVEYRMKNNISKESEGDTDDELMPSTSNLKIECKSDQSKEETKYDSNNNSVSRANGNVENVRRTKYSNQSQFLAMRNPNRRFTPRPLLNKERFGSRSNYGRYDAGAVHLQKYNTPSSTRYRNRNSPTNLSITGVDHQNGFGGDENRSDNQTPCSNVASNNLAVDCQSESAKTSVVPSPQYSVPQAPPGALIIPVPSNSYNTGPPSSQPVPINMQQPYAAGGQYNSCLGAPPSSTPLTGNIQMMPSPIMPGMVNNGYYTATGPIAPIHEGESDSGMQYQFVSQPPNMQIYIPTVNNAQNLSPLIPTQPVAGGPPLPPVAGSQGYWCPPAIHQTIPPIIAHNTTPQYVPANGIPFGANTPKTANYRREKQQQQQQTHAHQFE